MPQCQFLFSAVFIFQKSCTENILGIERDKLPTPYNYEGKTVPENDWRVVSQVARPHPGAASPWPMPGWCLGPTRLPDSAFSPIYSPIREKTLGRREIFHEKFHSCRHLRTRLERVLEVFSAP